MGGFRLAVGRVSLVHTLCYCQHRAPGRRARLDAGGQRMPCKFSSPSHRARRGAGGGRRGPPCGLNLLHTPELILNCRTVTTSQCKTSRNDGSICQNHSKCTLCGLNLLHNPELISNCQTVTTTACTTPSNDGSICQNRSKCTLCGLNLLHAANALCVA